MLDIVANEGIDDQQSKGGRTKSGTERVTRGGWSGSWATIRDLEVLRTVIQCGGVTSAARQLGISQPAVSRTLSQLEERSGRTFFNREGTQLAPTAEALQLFAASNGVFDALAGIEEFRWLEPEQERLSIVVAPTIGHCLLPKLVARFAKSHPHVTVSIDIRTTVEVISLVASDQANIGIAEVPEGDWNVRKHPFRRSYLAIAMRDDHPWSSRTSIRSDEVGDEPLILLLKRNPFRTMIDRLLWKEGSLPNVAVETADALSAVEHVEQGLGLAIVNPYPVMLKVSGTVRFARLEPTMLYETCLITNSASKMSPAAREFMTMVISNQDAATHLSEPIV